MKYVEAMFSAKYPYLEPLGKGLTSVPHEMMLAGVLGGDEVAIVRLADLKELLARVEKLRGVAT